DALDEDRVRMAVVDGHGDVVIVMVMGVAPDRAEREAGEHGAGEEHATDRRAGHADLPPNRGSGGVPAPLAQSDVMNIPFIQLASNAIMAPMTPRIFLLTMLLVALACLYFSRNLELPPAPPEPLAGPRPGLVPRAIAAEVRLVKVADG